MSSNNRVHTTLEVLQIITCQATTVEHLQITTTTCILETLTTTSMNFTLATILHLWTLALQQLIPGLKEKQEKKKRKKEMSNAGKKINTYLSKTNNRYYSDIHVPKDPWYVPPPIILLLSFSFTSTCTLLSFYVYPI